MARLALLSLVFVLLSGFVGYFIASSVSVPIPLYILLIYTPLIAMISGLPISIGGIGVRENLAVFFYAGLGFLPEDVVAYALTLTVLVFLVNLSGGAIMLFRVVRPVPGPVDRARSIS